MAKSSTQRVAPLREEKVPTAPPSQELEVLDTEPKTKGPEASATPDVMEDFELVDLELVPPELERVAGEPVAPTPGEKPAAAVKKPDEPSGDSMLARYFREMATHDVMGQEEELATAIGVERAEVEHWVSILAHMPAAEHALASLERDLPTGEEAIDLPQLAELRRLLKLAKKNKYKVSRQQEKKWNDTCVSLARAIRLADSDRLWIAHAEETVRKLCEMPEPDDDEHMDAPDSEIRLGASLRKPARPTIAASPQYLRSSRARW